MVWWHNSFIPSSVLHTGKEIDFFSITLNEYYELQYRAICSLGVHAIHGPADWMNVIRFCPSGHWDMSPAWRAHGLGILPTTSLPAYLPAYLPGPVTAGGLAGGHCIIHYTSTSTLLKTGIPMHACSIAPALCPYCVHVCIMILKNDIHISLRSCNAVQATCHDCTIKISCTKVLQK